VQKIAMKGGKSKADTRKTDSRLVLVVFFRFRTCVCDYLF